MCAIVSRQAQVCVTTSLGTINSNSLPSLWVLKIINRILLLFSFFFPFFFFPFFLLFSNSDFVFLSLSLSLFLLSLLLYVALYFQLKSSIPMESSAMENPKRKNCPPPPPKMYACILITNTMCKQCQIL